MNKAMIDCMSAWSRRWAPVLMLASALAGSAVQAQEIERIDPDAAIDADLDAELDPGRPGLGEDDADRSTAPPPTPAPGPDRPSGQYEAIPAAPPSAPSPAETSRAATAAAAQPSTTYAQDDLIGAAESVFGKGAEGLARIIEDVLSKQGEPNGYIVGREGGGAFILGVRYGSGTLFHRVEGQQPVYWTGPSIGLDAGANAGNTFVLVYNLYDTQDLYERYPAGEGQAYFVGGFTASYLRKGNVVLIPIRVGAGLRLGINAGYMRFSKEQRWLPF